MQGTFPCKPKLRQLWYLAIELFFQFCYQNLVKMEEQIKELVAYAKSLARELKQLKEAEAERRIRENEEKEPR